MPLTCGCCVFSGIGLCDWPILRPEESYPVYVCVLLGVIGATKPSTPKIIGCNKLRRTKKKNLLIINYSQQDAMFLEFIYFYKRSTYFRRFVRPSSGAHNCTYSFRYCQTNTAASCYRGGDGTCGADGVPSPPR